LSNFLIERGRAIARHFLMVRPSSVIATTGSGRGSETTLGRSLAFALGGLAIFVAAFANPDGASAQTSGVLPLGTAIVTGFSGAPLPAQIVAGQNPGDLTFIDPNGPSAQVFDLQAPGAPPQAQVIAAQVSLVVTAAQVGQVFGAALDNATPPNIYVAATSAYGLPIVTPGSGGAPARLHQGAPGATVMAGLFGPGGGPGSIWRIDGTTGAVRLFANVTLNGAVNSGPALGGLAFDSASKSLLVADRQTGMIHRFNLSGTEIGRYDHGTQGLAAAGQPQVPYAPGQIDITSPQFSSDSPATWGYASPQRLIFGLGVQAGRLYYAVASGLQVWSVSLAANGSFGNDARLELRVPPAAGSTEISKIVFDGSGNIILAERGAPTGDYELMAVAQAGIGRVLHYAPVPGALWQPVPDQYAIGFPGQYTNGNGGVAIGYSYDANGTIDPSSCGGFVWSTGEQLRNAADQTLAAALAANGSLSINGLQGNGIGILKPANVPPLLSYFADYDALLDDPAARGHMGDIAIPVKCAPAPLQQDQLLAPGVPLSPPLLLPPVVYVPLCPYGEPQTRNGVCHGYGGCPPGQVWDPRGRSCHPLPSCTNGMTRNPNGTCVCPAGEIINGGTIRCVAACPQGQTINPTTGRCAVSCPGGQIIDGGTIKCVTTCPQGQAVNPTTGSCGPIACPTGYGPGPNGTCTRNPTTCPPGQTLGPNGMCGSTPPPPPTCPLGQRMGQNGQCAAVQCPPGEAATGDGACVPATPCPTGQARNERGICAPACPTGQVRDLNGNCRAGIIGPSNPTPCPAGQTLESVGHCVVVQAPCPIAGEVHTSLPGGVCACPPGTGLAPNGCSEGYCNGGTFLGPGNCSCPQGSEMKSNGVCTCPSGQLLVNGSCTKLSTMPPSIPCQGGNVEAGKCQCYSGQINVNGVCACPAHQQPNAQGQCSPSAPPPPCPNGGTRNTAGACVPPTPGTPPPCRGGETRNAAGACVPPTPPPPPPPPCPGGEARNAAGVCPTTPPTPPPPCPVGQTRNAAGVCVAVEPPCPAGEVRNSAGACVKATEPSCPAGETRNASGECIRSIQASPPACPAGETRNASGACVSSAPSRPVPCPRGEERNAAGACEKSAPAPSNPPVILLQKPKP
jgi:hypothetical protein